jgi:glycosyltransferase 2 family protein
MFIALPGQGEVLFAQSETALVVRGLAWAFAVGMAAALAILFMPAIAPPEPIARIWKRIPFAHNIGLLVSGFRSYSKSPAAVVAALLWAAFVTLAYVFGGWCIAHAIHILVGFGEMLVVLAVAICVISLPISIGGHGVREAIFVVMFGALGVRALGAHSIGSREAAIAFSVLFFFLSSVWSVVGGFVYLGYRNRRLVASDAT